MFIRPEKEEEKKEESADLTETAMLTSQQAKQKTALFAGLDTKLLLTEIAEVFLLYTQLRLPQLRISKLWSPK